MYKEVFMSQWHGKSFNEETSFLSLATSLVLVGQYKRDTKSLFASFHFITYPTKKRAEKM